MARKHWTVALLVVAALCVSRSWAQVDDNENSKSKSDQEGTDATSEYPTLSPPPPPPDPLVHNLQFSLPISIVCILFFIIMVVIVVIVRKARYGQFCCLKPKMRFRYIDDEEAGPQGEAGSNTPPPTYKMTETIPPPDYTDALQDILVTQRKPGLTEDIEAQGERGEETTSMVEVPLDENDAEDDRAPLNP